MLRSLLAGLLACVSATAPAGAAAPRPLALRERPAALAPASRAEPPRLGPARGLALATAAGVVAAAAAPALWDAAPPLSIGYSLTVAGAVGPSVYRAVKARLRGVGAALALGAALGTAPQLMPGHVVEEVASVTVPAREIKAVPDAFGRQAAAALSRTPEGRKLLGELRDRGGVVRLPRFYVGVLDDAGGFNLPALDAVFLPPHEITSRGWTVEEFLSDPEKLRRLALEEDELLFHELFHSRQFRSWLMPGQRYGFLRGLLSLEMEHEAHLAEQRYVFDKLGALGRAHGLADFEDYLDDFDAFLADIDASSTYKLFRHTPSPYYDGALGAERAFWAANRAEGYARLARAKAASDPAAARMLAFKARRAALEAGRPFPADLPDEVPAFLRRSS